jgi:hypothetical protein
LYDLVSEGQFLYKPPDYNVATAWCEVPKGYEFPSTVSKVIHHLRQVNYRILQLKILTHADSGSMFLGKTLHEDNIWPAGWLKDFFAAPSYGIQLLGCGVASDTRVVDDRGNHHWGTFRGKNGRGYRLMRKLAEATGQPVEAGIHFQVNDARFELEGRCVRVYPDGHYVFFVGHSKE